MIKHRGFPGRLPSTEFQFVIRRANHKDGPTKITKRERYKDRKHADRMADQGFLAALWAHFGEEPFERGNLDAGRLSWLFGRRMRERGDGGIVLMSSLLAFHGVPGAAHYAATKAWVQTLAEGLRMELAPHGVRVIASAPGPIATGFAARARLHMPDAMPPQVVAHQTLVYGLVPPARSRLNALLFTGMFIGMSAGAALGATVWAWATKTRLAPKTGRNLRRT